MLPMGRKILLQSRATGQNVRVHPNGLIDANGATMPPAQWTIDPSPTGFMRLRNVAHPEHYIALRGGQLVNGTGGPFCELKAYLVGPNVYALRSAHEDLGERQGWGKTWPGQRKKEQTLSSVAAMGLHF